MRSLGPDDEDYPRSLLARGKRRVPPRLWVEGELHRDRRIVAIVGARRATDEALSFARTLAAGLAERGIIVVSGGAHGVDSAAHRGAADCGGITWVILPISLAKANEDARYKTLFSHVLPRGALVTRVEHDNVPPQNHARNELIVRLASAMVVVQAAEKSGSISAGQKGLAAKIPVYAFRGPCYDPRFAGGRILIENGAREPRSTEALIDTLSALPERAWTPDERAIKNCLKDEPLHVDQLVLLTALPAGRVASALLTLALDNVVVEGPSGCFRRNST